MELNKANEIKELAASLEEHAIFSYSKRIILFIFELAGWIVFVVILALILFLLFYVPHVNYYIDSKNYFEIRPHIEILTELIRAIALILFLLEIPVLLITFYLKRLRRRKSMLYELFNKIKTL